jgi:hypothetical protein
MSMRAYGKTRSQWHKSREFWRPSLLEKALRIATALTRTRSPLWPGFLSNAPRSSNIFFLLAVMLDAGPYSEQGESRLRARQAVLEGLSESEFVPIDGEHIGFVTTPWPLPTPPPERNAPKPTPTPDAPSIERDLLLPWEECEAITNPDRTDSKLTNLKRFFPPGHPGHQAGCRSLVAGGQF